MRLLKPKRYAIMVVDDPEATVAHAITHGDCVGVQDASNRHEAEVEFFADRPWPKYVRAVRYHRSRVHAISPPSGE